ncbi:MAG TPA: acyl carrier protein [Deltaproteobacteria bacterium]|nr:acyl carrier protein [Deltaproteobacteria bacterium]HOI08506.1 acyl carrier protein [Deltaproteobacteria bacterium]
MPEFRKAVERFIRDNFVMGRSNVALDPDVSLIESGIMDSTGVLELVEFLESNFTIRIDDEELVPENLETISNIVRFLRSKGIA